MFAQQPFLHQPNKRYGYPERWRSGRSLFNGNVEACSRTSLEILFQSPIDICFTLIFLDHFAMTIGWTFHASLTKTFLGCDASEPEFRWGFSDRRKIWTSTFAGSLRLLVPRFAWLATTWSWIHTGHKCFSGWSTSGFEYRIVARSSKGSFLHYI